MSTLETKPHPNKRAEIEPGELPRLIVGMLGYPGSGKSTFGRKLAEKINACCLDVDRLMNDFEKQGMDIEANKDLWKAKSKEHWRLAVDSKQSIIRPNQHNDLVARQELVSWGQPLGYQFVIAWMKVPREVAIERLIQRDESAGGFLAASRKDASKHIDWILSSFDPPAKDELVVEIDGCADFTSQHQTFEDFWRQLPEPTPKNPRLN